MVNYMQKYTLYACFGVISFCVAFLYVPSVAHALPAGFEVKTVVGGLNLPTSIAFAPDGRIFVAEKQGAVKIVKNGAVLATPFLQLADVSDYGDRGLIGIALDPDFAANGWVYVSYTYENDPANYEGPKTGRIARVKAVGDTADMGTMEVLVGTVGGTPQAPSCTDYPAGADCIPSDEGSHSMGGLRFGPDGMLYATLGDGSSFEFPDPLSERAQDIDSLAGKMLRLNSDGAAPSDNPFYNGDPTSNRSKVWSYGLRNAFRFSFHPNTGLPYLGDVGWFTAEEINKGQAGSNFGWPCREGYGAAPGYDCVAPNYVDPWYAYAHDPNTGAGSVTAGVFYQGSSYPAEYQGDYIFGDFAINFLKRIRVDAAGSIIAVEDFMANPGGPVEIMLGPDENIYYLAIYSGELRRITYTLGNRDPVAKAAANVTSGLTPLAVQFSSAGSFDPDGDPLSFLWDFGDGNTSTTPNPSHTYTQDGSYTATLTVEDGNGGMSSDSVLVVAGNEAPQAAITSPADGSTYVPDEWVVLSGTGVDAEDGALSGASLQWRIILHHNTHIHILQQLEGSDVSFLGPDHQATDVYVEVELTVTDSAGLQDTTSINVYLESSVPSGEFQSEFYDNMTLNGQPVLLRIDPAAHFNWGLAAPDPAVPADQFSARFAGDFNFEAGEYTFSVWADDGVRLFIDGNLIIDGWVDQAATLYQGALNLADGTHRVQLEYYDNLYNAVVELDWIKTGDDTPAPSGWEPIPPNGALDFDGIDDYIETMWWDIEEPAGFTFEARFVPQGFHGDQYLIAKSLSAAQADIDWAFGVREVSTTDGTLFFLVRADGILVELEAGTITLDEFVHASAVYDNTTMKLYKNGIEVGSIGHSGAVSTSANFVWLGNIPADATVGGFDGRIDELRVWNRPRTAAEILAASTKEQPGPEFNLIKNWKFHEGWGQVAFDTSGAGHDGRLGGSSDPDTSDPLYIGGVYPQGGTFTPSHTGTVVTPTAPTTGNELIIGPTITNIGDGMGEMILNMEVRASDGSLALGANTGIETFAAREAKTFSFLWTPTAADTYSISYGLTKPFWDGLYEWVGDAHTFLVTEGSTTTTPSITLVRAVSTPTDPVIGDTVTTDVTLRNDGAAGNMVVGLEIYFNAVSVESMYTGDEFFEAGEERIFSITHTPAQIGMYGIDMGVWGEGWSYFQGWASHIAEFTVTANTPPSNDIVVYDDVLRSGWASWSWDAAIDFAATDFVFQGDAAARVEYTAGWGGFFLHHEGVDTAGKTHVSFAISGGAQGGQELQIRALDSQTEALPPVSLVQYLARVPDNSWDIVAIPLNDLGVQPGDVITGFIFQDTSGIAGSVVYLDNISFSSLQ